MSNIEVTSSVHGIAPRSDELLRLGGDVERGRAKQEEYDALLSEETASWLAVQALAGITYLEDGKLRWQDHMRPIVKATTGFAPDVDNAPVTRWFETNSFYRKPTIIGELHLNAERLEEQLGRPGENISLLAPYSFSTLCDNQAEDIDLKDNVTLLYIDLLSYFQRNNTSRILFDEVAGFRPLGTSPVNEVVKLARAFPWLRLGYILSGKSPVVIPGNLPRNLDLQVGLTTIQHFRHVPPQYRPGLVDHELWQPIVNASTTVVDKVDVENWPKTVLAQIQPKKLVLTHDVDLERLPLPYAHAKVRRLGELAVQLSQYLNEEKT